MNKNDSLQFLFCSELDIGCINIHEIVGFFMKLRKHQCIAYGIQRHY